MRQAPATVQHPYESLNLQQSQCACVCLDAMVQKALPNLSSKRSLSSLYHTTTHSCIRFFSLTLLVLCLLHRTGVVHLLQARTSKPARLRLARPSPLRLHSRLPKSASPSVVADLPLRHFQSLKDAWSQCLILCRFDRAPQPIWYDSLPNYYNCLLAPKILSSTRSAITRPPRCPSRRTRSKSSYILHRGSVVALESSHSSLENLL